MTAAILPSCPSAQRPMAAARALITRKASSRLSIPEAAIAAYSPRECPATMAGEIPSFWTASKAIREVARIAGWAVSVFANSSAGKFQQACLRSKPRISLPVP